MGYILDYDASPLTQEELIRARVTLTVEDIHQLVELGYREAAQICKDLLHMPVPSLPLILAPLSGVSSKVQLATHQNKVGVDDEDSDAEGDEDEDTDSEVGDLDTEEHADVDADASAEAAALDAARYAGLCSDFDATVEDAREQVGPETATMSTDIITTAPAPPPPSTPILTSQILDRDGALSIRLMLRMRALHQSGTGTRSERAIKLDPKFTKPKELVGADDAEKKLKLSIQEASHRVRIAQALDINATRIKSARQIRWQTAAKEIEKLAPNGKLSHVLVLDIMFEMLTPIQCYLILRGKISQNCTASIPAISSSCATRRQCILAKYWTSTRKGTIVNMVLWSSQPMRRRYHSWRFGCICRCNWAMYVFATHFKFTFLT